MKEDLRAVKGMETKNNIIQASIKILAKEGIEGISTRKIAETLKISKSNIFHHFKSVENILDEVFNFILQAMIQPIKKQSFKRPEDFLMFLGQGIYNIKSEERTGYIVMFQLYTLSLYNKKYQKILLDQTTQIVNTMALVLKKLSLSDLVTCTMVSEMVLMTLDGYGLSALLDDNRHHYKKLWEINTHLWCGLLSENKGGKHD
jgi:AcrR family transcriptional regulator